MDDDVVLDHKVDNCDCGDEANDEMIRMTMTTMVTTMMTKIIKMMMTRMITW